VPVRPKNRVLLNSQKKTLWLNQHKQTSQYDLEQATQLFPTGIRQLRGFEALN
jgi:hypothetical protein